MWEPRRLTTLWAFTACYRDSFTFLPRPEDAWETGSAAAGKGTDCAIPAPAIELQCFLTFVTRNVE
jgi:hypothetical protein